MPYDEENDTKKKEHPEEDLIPRNLIFEIINKTKGYKADNCYIDVDGTGYYMADIDTGWFQDTLQSSKKLQDTFRRLHRNGNKWEI